MAGNTYSSPVGRINEVKGEMLAIAEPAEVLMLGFTPKKHPKNQGDNVTYRARIPAGGATTNANTINRWSVTASSYVVQEGVTPEAKALSFRDVNVQLQQYAVIYSYTDKTADMHEDNIPAEQQDQVAMEMGLVREMIRYGEAKASTNVQYSGGTTRATVDDAITYNGLSQMARTLMANGAMKKTSILKPGPDYDTSAIDAAYLVFVHTDAVHDIRRLEDFVPTRKYANGGPISPFEIGSVGDFRFIVSKELAPYLAAGAAVGSTGLESAGASNVDVYPFLVVAQKALYDVALNTNFDVNHEPANRKSKADLLGQRGYVSAVFWSAAKVVNNGWCGVIEAGVSDL